MQAHPIYKCSLPVAQNLADLQSVAEDLKVVRDFLTKLLAAKDDGVLGCALFSAAFITYRRCFNSGVRNGLTREDVLALPVDAIELHDYLIHQANKLVAHSVNPFEKTDVGVLVIDGQVSGVATMSARLINFDDAGIKQWGDLVAIIVNVALNPRIDGARSAVEVAAKALPIAEITGEPTLRYCAPNPDQAGKPRA